MVRDHWKTRTAFLFAAIGSAVGLGNLWRFPYLTYEYGGGAFLLPYLIALFVLGIPLLLLEFALGQKMQKGAIHAFKRLDPRLKGIGIAALLSSFIIVIYYAAVMAWSLVYFIKSFGGTPWAGDSAGYFFGEVLSISSGVGDIGGINLVLLGALLAIWIIIFLCVRNGVNSVGKVVMITVPLPIILLLALFLRGITLPGAMSGIAVYLTPDFTALLDPTIWSAAASQIFFTLSLAFGIMIAYASHNKNNSNTKSDAYITALSNSGISLFSGFVVFSILGFMATQTGNAISEVVASGPGLAFVVFPEAISMMPLAPLFAALFFLTLLSLGVDSAFSLVEAINVSVKDSYPRLKKSGIALVTCFVGFLGGILFVTGAGLYFLDIVDHFITNFGLVLVGLFECIAIGWIYGSEKMRLYINAHTTRPVGKWWNFTISVLIPIVLFVLLALQFRTEYMTPYEGYPAWALTVGWIAVLIPLIALVVPFFTNRKVEN